MLGMPYKPDPYWYILALEVSRSSAVAPKREKEEKKTHDFLLCRDGALTARALGGRRGLNTSSKSSQLVEQAYCSG